MHVNRDARVVAVEQSSWPDAQNPGFLVDPLRALAAASTQLSSST